MEPLDWFTIQVNIEPTYSSASWPDGIWHPWTKKYKSLRRAQQALPYIVKANPKWAVRIVTCHRPLSSTQRIALGMSFWDRGETVQIHKPL